VQDLKQRGLLDDTLVLWGGEFGRTPMVESNPALGRSLGRDHHPQAYTIWMAGGGIRRGLTYGATDELGCNVVDKPVHIHDVQATLLHLLGLDHERLTFRYAGRDFRLTDVHGRVVKDLIA
jgi:arylsulfatase A-like enzyme